MCILAKLHMHRVFECAETLLFFNELFKCLNLGQHFLFLVRIQCFDNNRKPLTVRAPLKITDNTKKLEKDGSGKVTDRETPLVFI